MTQGHCSSRDPPPCAPLEAPKGAPAPSAAPQRWHRRGQMDGREPASRINTRKQPALALCPQKTQLEGAPGLSLKKSPPPVSPLSRLRRQERGPLGPRAAAPPGKEPGHLGSPLPFHLLPPAPGAKEGAWHRPSPPAATTVLPAALARGDAALLPAFRRTQPTPSGTGFFPVSSSLEQGPRVRLPHSESVTN